MANIGMGIQDDTINGGVNRATGYSESARARLQMEMIEANRRARETRRANRTSSSVRSVRLVRNARNSRQQQVNQQQSQPTWSERAIMYSEFREHQRRQQMAILEVQIRQENLDRARAIRARRLSEQQAQRDYFSSITHSRRSQHRQQARNSLLRIHFRTRDGQSPSISVSVPPSQTVGRLKDELSTLSGIPKFWMQLLRSGQRMQDRRPLNYYFLPQNTTLELRDMRQARGAAAPPPTLPPIRAHSTGRPSASATNTSAPSSSSMSTSTSSSTPMRPRQPLGDCPICLCECTNPRWTPCGHVFCRDCIMQHLGMSDKCPLCRQTVATSRLRGPPTPPTPLPTASATTRSTIHTSRTVKSWGKGVTSTTLSSGGQRHTIKRESLEDGADCREQDEFNFVCGQVSRLGARQRVVRVDVYEVPSVQSRYESMHAKMSLSRELWVFHGTAARNITHIMTGGFKVGGAGIAIANGNMYGSGVYTATGPHTPMSFSGGGGGGVLLVKALEGVRGASERAECDCWSPKDDWLVFRDGHQLLPTYVVYFD